MSEGCTGQVGHKEQDGKHNAMGMKIIDTIKTFFKGREADPTARAALSASTAADNAFSDALDAILRSEYKHVKGDGIGYIKGQRYVLLSRRENFSEDGRKTRSGCWNQIRAWI